MTLRGRTLLGACFVQACFASVCLAQAKIESRTVSVPAAKEQELIASFHERALDSINDKELLEHLDGAKATKQPFLIIAATSRACDWVRYGPGGEEKRDERMAKVAPLVDRCLSSKEPFERLTGAMALLVLEENARLEKELARDSTFLLVRPEPEPGVDIFSAPTPGEAREVTEKRFRALMAVSAVADTRNRVIEMCGRLKVRAAKKHLEAIAADSQGQLVKQTAEAARAAIAVLENRKTPSDSPGVEFVVPNVPDEGPDPTLPNDLATLIEVPVVPLTAEEEKLAMKLLQQSRDDNGMMSDIEAGIRSDHPYLLICALEAAGRWCYEATRAGPKGEGRVSSLQPYIERCLSSDKALERMAGSIALLQMEEFGRFKEECEKDSSFLLVRPNSSVQKVKRRSGEGNGNRAAIRPEEEIEIYRLRLVSAVGRLKITSARRNLQSVLRDAQDDKNSLIAYEAKQALRKLDGG